MDESCCGRPRTAPRAWIPLELPSPATGLQVPNIPNRKSSGGIWRTDLEASVLVSSLYGSFRGPGPVSQEIPPLGLGRVPNRQGWRGGPGPGGMDLQGLSREYPQDWMLQRAGVGVQIGPPLTLFRGSREEDLVMIYSRPLPQESLVSV